MSNSTAIAIINFASYFTLLPCLIAIFRLRSPLRVQRLLSILVIISTLISISAHIIGVVFHRENLFLLHLLTIAEFVLLVLIYRNMLGRRFAYLLIGLFSVPAAVNSLFFERLDTFNVAARSTEAFILILLALAYFAHLLRAPKLQWLDQNPMIWINFGVLIYYSVGFFIFLFSKDLVPLTDLWFTYFGIHAIFTIFLYIFYTIALWMKPVPSTSLSS
jgi:hypothetical protein